MKALGRAALVGGLSLALGACSVIVGGDPPPTFACEPALASDPCQALDPPMRCVATEPGGIGTCQPCGQVEFCNEIDDDCDGQVDEDLDVDGDGFTGCRLPEGSIFDCDDNDPSSFPRPDGELVDPCDGVDNDCDPSSEDGSTECDEPGFACDPSRGCVEVTCVTEGCPVDQFCDQTTASPTCTPLDDSCFTVSCDPPQRCNPRTGTCVTPQPSGSPCDGDAECDSGLCVRDAALRASSVLGTSRGVCGEICCSDNDCQGASFCWASGTGLRACVPPALFATAPYPTPAVPHCSVRTQCGGTEDCVFDQDDALTVEGRASMACRTASVSRQSCTNSFQCDFFGVCLDGSCNEPCFEGSDCPSGLCLGSRLGQCTTLESEPCRSSDDCPGIAICINAERGRCADTCGSTEDCPIGDDVEGADDPSCAFVEARVSSSSRDDIVALCIYGASAGGGQGTPCTENTECRDLTCVGPEGEPTGMGRSCADTCCNDEDCGGEQQCRPVEIRGHWETHCLPRPDFPVLGTRPE